MRALLVLLAIASPAPALAQVGSSSTATRAAVSPPQAPPPPAEPKIEIDPLGDRVVYVGTPLLLPPPVEDVPAPPPPPPPPAPEPPPEPPPPEVVAAPPPAPPPRAPPPPPPPVLERERRTPPWFIANSPWIERLRSVDGWVLLIGVVFLMALAALLSSFVRRQTDRRMLLPRLASGTNKLIRIFVATLLLLLAIAWLPSDALPFALLAAALALGWSLRDVLPDLIAGAVIAFERRVRPGMWLSGDGFAGVVERVGLRATWLRDANDRRVAVPNRALVSTPVTSDDGLWPTRDVTIRMQTDLPAEVVRRAIIDAVLASPCSPVEQSPSVQRDGADPSIWHVRARILDLSFAVSFEGELLERAEAMLSFERSKRA